MIYKALVSTFGFCGVFEVSHLWLGKSDWLPLDPEAQLAMQGEISVESFAYIFLQRIERCRRFAHKSGRRLLIREHTHQYFFDEDAPMEFLGCSWVAAALQAKNQESVPIIVSVRDPVDSWLGMRASFPHVCRYDFSTYCRRYNLFLDRYERLVASGHPVVLFKYESFINDWQQLLMSLGGFIGRPPNLSALDAMNHVMTSGDSGRRSETIAPRPRRLYDYAFLHEATGSTEYRKLTQRLDYPPIR